MNLKSQSLQPVPEKRFIRLMTDASHENSVMPCYVRAFDVLGWPGCQVLVPAPYGVCATRWLANLPGRDSHRRSGENRCPPIIKVQLVVFFAESGVVSLLVLVLAGSIRINTIPKTIVKAINRLVTAMEYIKIAPCSSPFIRSIPNIYRLIRVATNTNINWLIKEREITWITNNETCLSLLSHPALNCFMLYPSKKTQLHDVIRVVTKMITSKLKESEVLHPG